MRCTYFDAARCRSCTLLDQPYAVQLAGKVGHCAEVLGEHGDLTWLPPVTSAEQGFRNKAKMVVGGSTSAPTLGILDPTGRGVDLRACPLYSARMHAALPLLADFVSRASITPYDVTTRSGELKHLLVTESPDGDLMVRLVLRSQEAVTRIRKHLLALQAALPQLAVASVNLLPEHKAVTEGEREILLTEGATLRMRVNGIDLHLRPQSFFQTNTEVAAALYRQVTAWVDAISPASMWDLYCGVGGFALHAATPGRAVTGIERSVEAVASARLTARELGLADVRFEAGDAADVGGTAGGALPELVVVNPPRRGIGEPLSRWLEASGVRHVVYSSCNAETLARDLRAMPSLRPREGRVLDMFPHTGHYEVAVRLERD
ncbi:23S rRNA (uracil(747)-C(5))-methyltransferase RlmC [Actinotalea subterranea]|uniref:23S rRNA (uracil(747)-C(5))-methyltransferase RlmC n=1 Tax=Actinotalea subterranea TaxID=2607497 RepID=UPI0011EDD1C2|nr:23S rRNA (uracil(747)-C(5))-methyltransferase RlmC [Actinotalea subterranea]